MRRFLTSLAMLATLAAPGSFAQPVHETGAGPMVAGEGDAAVTPPKKMTGKLAGTVVEDDANEPLPGAVVTILGTTLGANTDLDGRFLITDVPTGKYAVQAKMMGFGTVTISDVRVFADSIVFLKFRLKTKVIERPDVAITATRPMVSPDATGSTHVTTMGDGKKPAGSASSGSPGKGEVVKPSRDEYDRAKASTPAAPAAKPVEGKKDEAAYFADGAKVSEVTTSAGAVSTTAPSAATRPRPASPGMKAGSNDDNKQYNYYLGYLERFSNVKAAKLDVSGRVVFTVTDEDGRPIANCPLTVCNRDGLILAKRTTYADGRAMFFTTEKKEFERQDLTVEAAYNQQKISGQFSHNGKRQVDLKFTSRRQTFNNVPLDVVFLLDCTGSMGDEIARLKSTLQVINFQVSQLPSKPAVRFGMVQYRDRGDDYVTRVTPFLTDADSFQTILNAVTAGGGGDEPEDLQSGLKDAVTGMTWRDDACKLVFLVADAPPHLDYADQSYTYADAMRDAAGKGIKLVTVGASGLNDQGEYIFRQLSQYTMGQFIFLTYGEKGEISGGGTAAVSHHTGGNFQTENLDAIIVRIIKQELANYGGGAAEPDQDYFEAAASPDAGKDGVIAELFAEGIRQLLDYSIVRIDEGTPAAVMPVTFSDEALRPTAEVLEDKIVLNLAPVKAFRLLERKDLRQVMQELKLSLTGAFDDAHTVEAGKMIGAKVLILPKLHKGKDKLELYLKLVKVETGEILSITLLKLDESLL